MEKIKFFKKELIFFSGVSLFFVFSFSNICFAQEGIGADSIVSVPSTLQEAKEVAVKVFWTAVKFLPNILKKIWDENVYPVWQKMWNAFYNWWEGSLKPFIYKIFKKEIQPRAEEEIEKRKPIVEEELEKERQEMRQELQEIVPKTGETLWGIFWNRLQAIIVK